MLPGNQTPNEGNGHNQTIQGNTIVKDTIYNALLNMSNFDFARNIIANKIESSIYKGIIEEDTKNLTEVQVKKYHFLKSMLNSSMRNIEKGYFSTSIFKNLLKIFVGYSFIKPAEEQKQAIESFRNQYGMAPPTFLVVSPTQKCNLKCTGCYASSDINKNNTLSFDVFSKILDEAHDKFGIITIISGKTFIPAKKKV